MFTYWGPRHRFCDGLARRDFLALGAFGTLTLADRLRAADAGRSAAPAKSAIMVYLPGGPSHISNE